MIVQESFLKKLRAAFDLNIYEVKIWTALLSRGIATAGELSDIGGVPRSRSYDVLEGLEKKGFVIMKIGKPIKYIAVKPEEIIKRVKKNISEQANEQIEDIDKIKDTEVFDEMDSLFKEGVEKVDPNDISGSIKGRKNLYSHIENLIENAKESVVIVTTSSGFMRKFNEFSKAFKKAKENGVKIRIVTDVNEHIENLVKDMKFLKVKNGSLNGRFVIIDGKDVVFMISNDKDVHESYDTGIWVKSEFFGKALENLFNSVWEK